MIPTAKRNVGRNGARRGAGLAVCLALVVLTGCPDRPAVQQLASYSEEQTDQPWREQLFRSAIDNLNQLDGTGSSTTADQIFQRLARIRHAVLAGDGAKPNASEESTLLATWPEPGVPGGTVLIDPWDGFPTRAELIRHYGEHSSRSVEAADWYGVMACYKLGIILEGTHARAYAGKAPKDIGDLLHATTVGLFERALAAIAGS